MGIQLVTGPVVEPVSLDDMKSHMVVDTDLTADDALIRSYTTAARLSVETFLGRALVTQTWDFFRDCWPRDDRFPLPYPPHQSVASMTYRSADGSTTTMTADQDYLFDPVRGQIVLPYGVGWPGSVLYPVNAITVRFVAGYGDAQSIPGDILLALKMLTAHWYQNREPITFGQAPQEIPLSYQYLLWPHKVVEF